MNYDDLYKAIKEEIPEGLSFFEMKEKENLVDENDGMHVIFGMVIVPYIFHIMHNKEKFEFEINKIFIFLEKMATCEDIKINEILEFTILEQLENEGDDIFEQCKQYMQINTLKYCEKIL